MEEPKPEDIIENIEMEVISEPRLSIYWKNPSDRKEICHNWSFEVGLSHKIRSTQYYKLMMDSIKDWSCTHFSIHTIPKFKKGSRIEYKLLTKYILSSYGKYLPIFIPLKEYKVLSNPASEEDIGKYNKLSEKMLSEFETSEETNLKKYEEVKNQLMNILKTYNFNVKLLETIKMTHYPEQGLKKINPNSITNDNFRDILRSEDSIKLFGIKKDEE